MVNRVSIKFSKILDLENVAITIIQVSPNTIIIQLI